MKSIYFLALILLVWPAWHFWPPVNPVGIPERPAVVYPKYRTSPSPAAGEQARFNPPSLQWPAEKKKTYAVRLCQAADFSKNCIEQQDIAFAIFNPHQKLAAGKWYWQYRTGKENWGQVDSFVIDPASRYFASPPVAQLIANIPSDHPRVLVHRKNWESFRRRAREYAESRDIIEEANGYLSAMPPKEQEGNPDQEGETEHQNNKLALLASKDVGNEVGRVLNTLTQAYVLTGDKSYFATARTWMLEIAKWDPKGVTHRNDFGDSNIMLAMVLGLDTFWDQLDPAERTQITAQVSARAEQFYRLWINNVEAKSTSMHVWQHILHRMVLTSVALMHEVPQAATWMAYLYELWIAQNPKMGETDGAWFNGTGYMRMNVLTMLEIPAVFQQYTGVDFLWPEWYQRFPVWLNYAFPPGAFSDGFCNDGDRYQRPSLEYVGFSDAFARMTGNTYAAWYAEKCLATQEKSLSEDQAFRWFRLQWGYEKTLPKPPVQLDLPQAAVFPEVGVAYMNSDLTRPEKNLMLSIRSSPFGPQGHTHADQNTFNIAYGGKRLFYNTGYRAAMGDPHFLAWYKHTQGHNGILIDGQGQPFDAGAYGFIPRFLHGRQLSYAVGDASTAYRATDLENTDSGLKVFRRHYLLLQPSIIVIYDELEADHEASWSWLIHHDKGLAVNAEKHTITGENEAGAGQITLLASSPIDFTLTDQFSVQPDNFTNKVDGDGEVVDFVDQWHFAGVSQQKTHKMRYLAMIQVSPDRHFTPVLPEPANGGYRIGKWLIQAELDADQPASFEVHKADGSLGFISSGVLRSGKMTYRGKSPGSAKLLEMIDGKLQLRECMDELPAAVLSALHKERLQK